MRKMFSKGVLSVAVCIGMCAGSSKADFEADLLSVLNFVFSREAVEDPLWWVGEEGCDADAYCCEWGELYRNFCKEVRNIVQNNRALRLSETELAVIGEKEPDAFSERAFCLLQLGRDLYGKGFEYVTAAYDLGDTLQNIDASLLSECHYAFARRVLGLSKFIIRHCAQKLGLNAFVDTKDLKPNEKILAEILEPFAKNDAYQELQSNDNNSQLVQSLHVLSNVFDKFSRNNGGALKEMKEACGEPLSSWFGISKSENEMNYREYVLERSEALSVALQDLSKNVWERVERMLSVKDKLSAEQKKEALPFLKKAKDIGEVLKDAEKFRDKEKEERKKEQEAFAKAKAERKRLESKTIEKTKMLKAKKRELNEISENGTGISDKEELGNEVQELRKMIEMLKTQINELPYPSIKSKHKMQRKAAKEGIEKEEHDAAVFANYVQLPCKCDAFQNAFLYYQTIMWNVFTDALMTMREYEQRIYGELKIKMPELTDDFEEEYHNLVKDI